MTDQIFTGRTKGGLRSRPVTVPGHGRKNKPKMGSVGAKQDPRFDEVDGVVRFHGQPVSEIANPSCRSCYGTGVIGTRQNRDGSKTRLVCPCVPKRAG